MLGHVWRSNDIMKDVLAGQTGKKDDLGMLRVNNLKEVINDRDKNREALVEKRSAFEDEDICIQT